MVEPRACVPSAKGSMRAATAAAEPLDEPPGVRAEIVGLRVRAGSPRAEAHGLGLADDHRAAVVQRRDRGGVADRAVAAEQIASRIRSACRAFP